MKRTVFALAIGIATFGAATRAEAQRLGSQGDAIFSAERIFGIRGERQTIDNPAPQEDSEIDATTISLGLVAQPIVPYNVPRVAFDYMAFDFPLSLGGALLYSNVDAEDEDGDDAGISDFEVAPRVGYLHMFGDVVGIWPRGGLSYHSRSVDDAYDATVFGLHLECMFPIVVRQHFGVLVGFAFDQSLSGNLDPEDGPDRDLMWRSIGLQAGLFGWI
jgi:hypothetical protein